MARVYYDSDADLSVLDDRKVAIIGYGNQGRAQGLAPPINEMEDHLRAMMRKRDA